MQTGGERDWKVGSWLEGCHNNPVQGIRGKGKYGHSGRPREGSVDKTQLPNGTQNPELSAGEIPYVGKMKEMVVTGTQTGETGLIYWTHFCLWMLLG